MVPMDSFLEAAISEARQGLREGGIPIGSVIVYGGEIIGRGHNRRVQQGSAILHAEMDALENADRQPASVYRECVLYTTLSPCPMCSGAILLYGIPRVVVGENRTYIPNARVVGEPGVINAAVSQRVAPYVLLRPRSVFAIRVHDWRERRGKLRDLLRLCRRIQPYRAGDRAPACRPQSSTRYPRRSAGAGFREPRLPFSHRERTRKSKPFSTGAPHRRAHRRRARIVQCEFPAADIRHR
jgi:cytosine/creatinine deaminase